MYFFAQHICLIRFQPLIVAIKKIIRKNNLWDARWNLPIAVDVKKLVHKMNHTIVANTNFNIKTPDC